MAAACAAAATAARDKSMSPGPMNTRLSPSNGRDRDRDGSSASSAYGEQQQQYDDYDNPFREAGEKQPSVPRPERDEETELELLRRDNQLLQAALRRCANGKEQLGQVRAFYTLQAAYERRCKQLKESQAARRVLESTLERERNALSVLQNRYKTEIQKHADMAASRLAENMSRKEKAREDEALINVLRRENMRLTSLCTENGLNPKELQPSEFKNLVDMNAIRPERAQYAVASAGKALSMAPNEFRRGLLNVHETKRQLAKAERNRSPNFSVHSTPVTGRSTARGQHSPKGNSQSPLHTLHTLHTIYNSPNNSITPNWPEVNSRVTWKGMQGTVRYVGPVEAQGEGDWYGIELQEGRGEHAGAAYGIRFFVAPPRSSVFCRLEELQPPRDDVVSPPRRTSSPPLAPTTRAERKQLVAEEHQRREDEAREVEQRQQLKMRQQQLQLQQQLQEQRKAREASANATECSPSKKELSIPKVSHSSPSAKPTEGSPRATVATARPPSVRSQETEDDQMSSNTTSHNNTNAGQVHEHARLAVDGEEDDDTPVPPPKAAKVVAKSDQFTVLVTEPSPRFPEDGEATSAAAAAPSLSAAKHQDPVPQEEEGNTTSEQAGQEEGSYKLEEEY